MNKYEFDAEIFSVGTWNGDEYTEKDLQEMVFNFNKLAGAVKPPVKLGHQPSIKTDGQPALGWVKSLRYHAGRLIATLTEVPEIVYKSIKAGLYKRVSSEIFWNFRHEGQVFSRVLSGVALLGADIPAVTNLADLEAFLTQSTDSKKSGSFAKFATYEFDTTENGNIINERGKEMDTKEYEQKALAAEERARAAETKLKQYELEREIERKQAVEKIKSANLEALKKFCEDLVKAGKMLPASRDIILENTVHSYSEAGGLSISAEAVMKAIDLHAEAVLKFTESSAGNGSNSGKDQKSIPAALEVDQKAIEYSKKNNVDYEKAVNAVLAADKELASRYINGGGNNG